MLDFKPRNFSLDRYAMLSATAEITAREMARERLLQLQRQQLHSNTRAPPSHLRTAIDRCHGAFVCFGCKQLASPCPFASCI